MLRSVSSGHADLPRALEGARSGLADERDRALTSEIATGVERWRAALDHTITGLSKRPLEDLDPEILDILRLSAYQIIHLTRVPGSAVVNDAVNLTKATARKPAAAGFVNALLRSLLRQRGDVKRRLPPRPAEAQNREAALDYLSITLSHPRWLAARWLDRYGFEAAERWLLFNNTPAPITMRANRLRIAPEDLSSRLVRDGVIARPGRFAADALIVERPITRSSAPRPGSSLAEPLLLRRNDGSFVFQSEESQLVAMIAGPTPGSCVLDACASPGGKTTALAAAMQGRGLLVACDVRDRRMRLLRRSVRTSGADNVRLVQANLLAPLPFVRAFDCVLVDAPCSGLGILRRDPDIRWRRREEDLPALAAAQVTMLDHAADAVRPGGRLIYATCSGEPEENETVVDRFLGGRVAEFERIDLRQADAHLPAAVIDDRGFLRTSPLLHGLDAFFGALLRRRA